MTTCNFEPTFPAGTVILVAEGDRAAAASLTRELEAHGLSTAIARDGRAAAARAGEFDLLLLNASLPVKDGVAVVRELRDDGVTVPVVMLAADDDRKQTVAALNAGADDYLARPFYLEELLARIHARLREALPA
jgi:two-component system, OmpR family, copper resistance phosphate regulon response regulator CusR